MSDAKSKLAALLGETAAVGVLAPIETRLVKISVDLFPQMLQSIRVDTKSMTFLDVTADLAARAAVLSLAAAVAMDDELRKLRSQLEAMR